MFVTKEEIERVRERHDLVEVVESRGVRLVRKGRNFVGLCPFHDDHEPSLVINPDRQLWNCFGACRRNGDKSGGDVFAFVAKADGITFLEALKKLGYEEPERPTDNGTKRKRPKPTPLSQASFLSLTVDPDLLNRVAGHYHRVFRERSEGQEYLKSRGLVDPDMLSAFQVGYVDGTLRETFDAQGDTAKALKEVGLLNARGCEHFLGCVVVPLTQPDRGAVGFYGRHVEKNQHLYLPGPRKGVFHWQVFRGSQEIILTESVIDALSLYQAGLQNVSCVYGTQGFTPDHAELLQRFQIKRVLLCLDRDEAGDQATEIITERIRKLGIDVIDSRLSGAKDPNELLTTKGPEAIRAALKNEQLPPPHDSMEPSSHLTVKSTAKEENDASPSVSSEPGGVWVSFGERRYRVRGLTSSGLDRLRVNLRIESKSRVHLDTLDLYSHRARVGLVKELTQLFEKDEEEIFREITSLVETLEKIRLEMGQQDSENTGAIEIPDREREEALRLLRSPNLLRETLGDFERSGFVGERTALTLGYLGTLSRLLDEPLGLLIVSRSGAGKSRLQDALCDFVPEEDLSKYTRLTGQALFYKEEESLVHKVLAIDEEQGAEEAGYSIRTLQSAQVLSIAATRTDPQTGRLRTDEYRVKGPVSILLTTTSPEALDYETRSRFVQIGIDESQDQTRKILERQREADTLEGVLRREETSIVRRRQQNLQRLLRPLKVVNPYASLLSYPDERLQMRREQKKYLTLIKTIALLHQHQREIKRARRNQVTLEYVEVKPGDITLANELAREGLGRALDELAHPTRQLLKLLVEMTRKNGRRFTRTQVRTFTGWSDWQVRVHLQKLLEMEYVVIACGGNGRLITYELLFEGDPDEQTRYLAGLVDVEEILAREEAAKKARESKRFQDLVSKTATL